MRLLKRLPIRLFLTNNLLNKSTFIRNASIKPNEAEEYFVKPQVQSYLKTIIGYEPEVIFADQPTDRLHTPRYIFMTNDELKISMERVKCRADKIIELPPYKAPVEEISQQVLSTDPEIVEVLDNKIVFTDISSGFADSNRLIVVRETNGILRRANRDERYRMNQIYYPDPDRFYEKPKMFQTENLKRLLDEKEYKYILDRTIVQFEPSDPEYHSVFNAVFTKMNEERDYTQLWGSRYFGSLAFHMVINGSIDNLLEYLLNQDKLDRAVSLVSLYYTLHSEKQKEFKELTDQWQQLKVST